MQKHCLRRRPMQHLRLSCVILDGGRSVPGILLVVEVLSPRRQRHLLLLPGRSRHDPPLPGWRRPSYRLLPRTSSFMPRVMALLCPTLQLLRLLVSGGLIPSAVRTFLPPVSRRGSRPLQPRSGSSRHPQPRCAPRNKGFSPLHLQRPTQQQVSNYHV